MKHPGERPAKSRTLASIVEVLDGLADGKVILVTHPDPECAPLHSFHWHADTDVTMPGGVRWTVTCNMCGRNMLVRELSLAERGALVSGVRVAR